MARSALTVLALLMLAACSGAASPVASRMPVRPVCEPPPTITVAGSPIPIALICSRAAKAAFDALPSPEEGHFIGDVSRIEFHYGAYCPDGWRCGPFAGQGDLGFVEVWFADRSVALVNVKADERGVVEVVSVGPLPSDPRVVVSP